MKHRLLTGCLAVIMLISAMAVSAGAASAASPAEQEEYSFKIFMTEWASKLDETGNLIFEELQKQNNVKVEIEFAPASNYTEKVQLMLVSGNYPEVVLFENHTHKPFVDGVNQGVFIPVTEYFNNTEYLKDYTYDAAVRAVKIIPGEDEMYMLPRTSISRYDGYAVREDWLENLGISIPEDYLMELDEFYDMLAAFTHDDPDGNGKDDTYGLVSFTADGFLVPEFYNYFGLMGWQAYEDEEFEYMDLIFSRKSDNFKQALEYTAKLWADGLIQPDWPLTNINARSDKYFAGEAGVMGVFPGHVKVRQDELQSVNPDGRITFLAGVKNPDGSFQGPATNLGIWGGFALSTKAKDPERIVSFFDSMLSDENWNMIKYGFEGKDYKIEDGNKVALDGYYSDRWTGNFLRRKEDPTFFLSLALSVEDRTVAEGWLKTSIDAAVFPVNNNYRPTVADDPKYIDADTRRKTTINEIITGEKPADAYDAALEDWYKNGGTDYIEEMNEYIKSIQ